MYKQVIAYFIIEQNPYDVERIETSQVLMYLYEKTADTELRAEILILFIVGRVARNRIKSP